MLKVGEGALATRFGAVPVKRLVARQNSRNEPITYWITVGDKAIRSGIEQKMQRLAYGLSGKIPDGMLVRVSTIAADEPAPAACRTASSPNCSPCSARRPRAPARRRGADG